MKCACPCGREFEPKRKGQIYFDAQCRQRDKNRRWPLKRQSVLPVALGNGPSKRSKAKTSGVTPLPGTQMAQAEKRAPDWPRVEMFDRVLKEDRFLTPREVAQLLGVSVFTVRGWRSGNSRAGREGPEFVRIGGRVGRIRYSLRSLRRYLVERAIGGRRS